MAEDRPTLPRLKILQIGKYFSPDTGGIETVTQGISEALEPENIQANVLCFGRDRDYPRFQATYDVWRARSRIIAGTKPISIDYVRQVRARAADHDLALLHLPNPIGMAAALAFWRGPLILVWHADILPYPALRPLIRPLEAAVIRQADAVISPTPIHTAGSYLADALVAKRIVIPYPFDATRLPIAVHDSAIIGEVHTFLRGRRMILAVGRLVPYKGFDVLIRAAALLDPSLAICIVGGGPLAEALARQAAAEHVADRVKLLGPVGDAELSALYERSFAVTMPSVTRSEMYGMTQVEAMSYGKPVVSTRIPRSGVSFVNIDGITGLTVEPSNTADLAEALNRLGGDPVLHATLSAGAKRTARESHGISIVGRQYADLIRLLVAERPRHRQ